MLTHFAPFLPYFIPFLSLYHRLDVIEDEITDERAELVATAGLLNQNDKLREQIQQEEREKMKIEFEGELVKAKQTLDLERQNVRDVINSEMQQEKDNFRSEIKLLKSLLHAEEVKNAETSERLAQAVTYSESLEVRLADSEVAQEEVQGETQRLQEQINALETENSRLTASEKEMRAELEHVGKDGQNTIEAYKEEMLKKVEEAKYEMFRHLMDAFEQERKVLEKAHNHTQGLLSQAAKVLLLLIYNFSSV